MIVYTNDSAPKIESPKPEVNLADIKKAQLIAMAEEMGIDLNSRMTKASIVKLLENQNV